MFLSKPYLGESWSLLQFYVQLLWEKVGVKSRCISTFQAPAELQQNPLLFGTSLGEGWSDFHAIFWDKHCLKLLWENIGVKSGCISNFPGGEVVVKFEASLGEVWSQIYFCLQFLWEKAGVKTIPINFLGRSWSQLYFQ